MRFRLRGLAVLAWSIGVGVEGSAQGPCKGPYPARPGTRAAGTGWVVGTVVDSLGYRLGGATVSIVSAIAPTAAPKVVYADGLGRFRIDDVELGDYVVGATAAGHVEWTHRLRVNGVEDSVC